MKRWKVIISVLLILSLGTGTYAWLEFNREHANTADIKPSFLKDAITLLKEFEQDEAKAGMQYTDRIIAVNGNVIKVEKDDSTQKVLLGERSSLGGVLCEFDPRYKTQLDKLQAGQQVKIKGVCTGMLMDVILTRCVLLEK